MALTAPHHQQSTMLSFRLTLPFILSYLFISFSRAQQLPQCSVSCVESAAQASGCDLADTACICSRPVFTQAAGVCVQRSCNPSDARAAATFFNNLCRNGRMRPASLLVPRQSVSTTRSPTPTIVKNSTPIPSTSTSTTKPPASMSSPKPSSSTSSPKPSSSSSSPKPLSSSSSPKPSSIAAPPIHRPVAAPPSHRPVAAPPSHRPVAAPPSHRPVAAPPSHRPVAAPPSHRLVAAPPNHHLVSSSISLNPTK
ncbi:hypothetical protein BJV78DRAFT_428869 [Lactifluus subvellereus]|nr:hypothetical protein BJV78DRAFT_428869 [Lactifluus subvellereus]